jgi:hypothetical protein
MKKQPVRFKLGILWTNLNNQDRVTAMGTRTFSSMDATNLMSPYSHAPVDINEAQGIDDLYDNVKRKNIFVLHVSL